MDIRQLRYFYTICEEGQITAAARKLHMAQPPLSQALQSLEKELGVVLLKRGTRSIQLTDAGQLLKERAEVIIRLCDGTKAELQDAVSQLHRTLSIGIVTSSHHVFLQKGIQDFHRQCPFVDFQLMEGNTFQILDMLEKGLIEIGIVRTPFVTHSLTMLPLVSEVMVAAFAKRAYDETSAAISIVELQAYPLIYYERYAAIINELFTEYGFPPHVLCLNQDARTTLLWADAGLGVGIVPASALQLVDQQNLFVREISEPRFMTSIMLVYRKDRYISEIAQTFIAYYQKHREVL